MLVLFFLQLLFPSFCPSFFTLWDIVLCFSGLEFLVAGAGIDFVALTGSFFADGVVAVVVVFAVVAAAFLLILSSQSKVANSWRGKDIVPRLVLLDLGGSGRTELGKGGVDS